MNFVKINNHFEITEGSTFELVEAQLCRITSPGTLRALSRNAIAEAHVKGSISKAMVKGAIAQACVKDSIAIPYSEQSTKETKL